MESIHVAMIGNPMPRSTGRKFGGPMKVVSLLIEQDWMSRGVELTVLSPKPYSRSPQDRKVREANSDKCEIRQVGITSLPAELKHGQYSLVNVHGISDFNAVASLCGKVVSPSAIGLSVHGLAIEEYRARAWVRRRHLLLERLQFACASWITTVSAPFAEAIQKHYPLRGKDVLVIPNGVDEFWFRIEDRAADPIPAPRSDFLMYVGETSINKGTDLLLRTFGQIPKGAGLVMVTKRNQLLTNLLSETVRDDAHDRILILEAISDEALKRLYQNAVAVVLPSRSDSYPLVALEAMASGTPAILSAAVGPARLMESAGAALVFDGSPKGLLQCVEEILSNASRQREMSARAFEFAKKHSWQRIADMYAEAFRNLVNRT